jgi:hypothetical protein
MLTHDRDIKDISKSNNSILQTRPKLSDISYNINKKGTRRV